VVPSGLLIALGYAIPRLVQKSETVASKPVWLGLTVRCSRDGYTARLAVDLCSLVRSRLDAISGLVHIAEVVAGSRVPGVAGSTEQLQRPRSIALRPDAMA
jgi:hypothetical protein